jgi:hypothetical protein
VLDDLLQVLPVLIQGYVLFMSWDTCIVSTEEDCLRYVNASEVWHGVSSVLP